MQGLAIDCETLALEDSAVILSISACEFMTNEFLGFQCLYKRTYTWRPSIMDQLLAGRTVCPKTVAWWTKQPEEVRAVELNREGRECLVDDVHSGMYERLVRADRIYVRGDLDVRWLKSLTGLEVPFRAVRDTRSLLDDHIDFEEVAILSDADTVLTHTSKYDAAREAYQVQQFYTDNPHLARHMEGRR